jgi:mannose-1-phosphate guanylyltransferase/mannose-6-phosphate isomerase
MPDDTVIPVLLAGGSGTRLWPVSRKDRPKQFAAFRGDRTLFQEACLRVNAPGFAPPVVLANAAHRFQVAEQLQEIGIKSARIVLEPTGRDTAPAACIAALIGAEENRDALVLLSPCDHVLGEDAKFRDAIEAGIPSARSAAVVVFGVRPTRPHTGYGYIEVADGSAKPPLKVKRFVEKPDKATAEKYLAGGKHFWNAGVFLFTASTMLDAFAKHEPGILAVCRAALAEAESDPDFTRLAAQPYAEAKKISLDYAIMEKVSPIACVPLDTFWSDCGSWPSLREIAELDATGNAARGDVLFIDATNSMARSDDRLLVVYGLDRVVAVATPDAVLVASLDRADDLKRVVSALEAAERPETSAPEGLRQPGAKAT